MHIAHAVFLCFFPTIFYCNLFSTLAPGEEPFFHTEFTKTTELRKKQQDRLFQSRFIFILSISTSFIATPCNGSKKCYHFESLRV